MSYRSGELKHSRAAQTMRPKPPRGRRFQPEVLTPIEVATMLDACSKRLTGIRNRAMLVMLWRAGLRITETLRLLPKDLDAVQGSIRILNGKGGKARTVGMDPAAFEYASHWLVHRHEREIGDAAPVFCMLDGRPLSSSYVRLQFHRLGRAAVISKRVHPHGLRHTHAAELRSEGIDIGIISKQLGHTSIATPARYLDHIAPIGNSQCCANARGKTDEYGCYTSLKCSVQLAIGGTDPMKSQLREDHPCLRCNRGWYPRDTHVNNRPDIFPKN
jgi:site-specific recombinase XerD